MSLCPSTPPRDHGFQICNMYRSRESVDHRGQLESGPKSASLSLISHVWALASALTSKKWPGGKPSTRMHMCDHRQTAGEKKARVWDPGKSTETHTHTHTWRLCDPASELCWRFSPVVARVCLNLSDFARVRPGQTRMHRRDCTDAHAQTRLMASRRRENASSGTPGNLRKTGPARKVAAESPRPSAVQGQRHPPAPLSPLLRSGRWPFRGCRPESAPMANPKALPPPAPARPTPWKPRRGPGAIRLPDRPESTRGGRQVWPPRSLRTSPWR